MCVRSSSVPSCPWILGYRRGHLDHQAICTQVPAPNRHVAVPLSTGFLDLIAIRADLVSASSDKYA